MSIFAAMKYIKLSLYLLFALLLFALLPERIGFATLWKTFYWDMEYVRDLLAQPGGLSTLVTNFMVQFMANRWTAALLLALPCWLVCLGIDALISRWWPRLSTLVSALAVAAGAWVLLCDGLSKTTADKEFQTQMCQLARRDWQQLATSTKGTNNLLELNLRNLAWAEMGQLPQHVMPQQGGDVLVVSSFQSPYVAAMVSEIYWTMGEVAMSQCYAFQANEKLGNLSPLLLKRLAQTNIVYGQYDVARKYLRWLQKSLFDRDWAETYLTKLSDEAVEADPELRLKRRCIPGQNGFPSLRSVVYDLQQIIASNPEHKTSAQYLDALKVIYPDIKKYETDNTPAAADDAASSLYAQ